MVALRPRNLLGVTSPSSRLNSNEENDSADNSEIKIKEEKTLGNNETKDSAEKNRSEAEPNLAM